MKQETIDKIIKQYDGAKAEEVFLDQLSTLIIPENAMAASEILDLPHDDLPGRAKHFFEKNFLYVGRETVEQDKKPPHYYHHYTVEPNLVLVHQAPGGLFASPSKILTIGFNPVYQPTMIGITFNISDMPLVLQDEKVLQLCLLFGENEGYKMEPRYFQNLPYRVPVNSAQLIAQQNQANRHPFLN